MTTRPGMRSPNIGCCRVWLMAVSEIRGHRQSPLVCAASTPMHELLKHPVRETGTMIPYTGWVRSLADTTGVAMFEITGRGKISDRQGEECGVAIGPERCWWVGYVEAAGTRLWASGIIIFYTTAGFNCTHKSAGAESKYFISAGHSQPSMSRSRQT